MLYAGVAFSTVEEAQRVAEPGGGEIRGRRTEGLTASGNYTPVVSIDRVWHIQFSVVMSSYRDRNSPKGPRTAKWIHWQPRTQTLEPLQPDYALPRHDAGPSSPCLDDAE